MVLFRRTFESPSIPNTPAMDRDIFHLTRLPKAPSNLPWNTSRLEEASTPSQGNLFQCLIILTAKNVFLILLIYPFFFQFGAISPCSATKGSFKVIILCLTRICSQPALLSLEYGESPCRTS